jgi:hypothetical protein
LGGPGDEAVSRRRGNGRFTRNTLANTFGLNVEICERPACWRMTPYALGEQKPTVCQACKLPFEALPSAPGELEPDGLATGTAEARCLESVPGTHQGCDDETKE